MGDVGPAEARRLPLHARCCWRDRPAPGGLRRLDVARLDARRGGGRPPRKGLPGDQSRRSVTATECSRRLRRGTSPVVGVIKMPHIGIFLLHFLFDVMIFLCSALGSIIKSTSYPNRFRGGLRSSKMFSKEISTAFLRPGRPARLCRARRTSTRPGGLGRPRRAAVGATRRGDGAPPREEGALASRDLEG